MLTHELITSSSTDFLYSLLNKDVWRSGHDNVEWCQWKDAHKIVEFYRNDPVKSDTPGHKSVWASTFAPLLVSFRMRFHPCTPPPFTYRVPVTILAFVSSCFLNDKNKVNWSLSYEICKRSRNSTHLMKLGKYFGCTRETLWVSSTIDKKITKQELVALTWCERSASMITTKSPEACFKPWIYAVPEIDHAKKISSTFF